MAYTVPKYVAGTTKGTLGGAAKELGITLEELLNANPQYKANPNLVREGAVLQTPEKTVVTPETTPTPSPRIIPPTLPDSPQLGGIPGITLSPEVQKAQELITTSRPAIDSAELERQTKAQLAPQRESLARRLEQKIAETKGLSEQEKKSLEGQLGTQRRFSSSAQAFISFIDEKNKKAVANLEVQRDEALQNFDFEVAQLIDKRIATERTNQQQELENAFKIVEFANKQQEAEAKRREPLIKSEQDAAIVDLYETGETNPLSIFGKIKDMKDGAGTPLFSTISFQSVLDVTDNMASEKFTGIVGEWKDAIRAGAIPEETGLFDYINGKDPKSALELKKLGLDIQKLEKDLRGTPGDNIVGTPQGQAISDTVRTLKFTSVADRKDATAFVRDLLAAGRTEDAKEAMMSFVSNSSSEAERTIINGKDDAVTALRRIQENLDKFETKGGKTNLFTGLSENALQKGGLTRDPELAELANDIAIAIVDYRRAVSGAAFTESEGKAYEKIYPSVGNTKELNGAKIRSLITKFEGDKENYLKRKIGERKYGQIFGEDEEGISEDTEKTLSDDEAYEIYQRSLR